MKLHACQIGSYHTYVVFIDYYCMTLPISKDLQDKIMMNCYIALECMFIPCVVHIRFLFGAVVVLGIILIIINHVGVVIVWYHYYIDNDKALATV